MSELTEAQELNDVTDIMKCMIYDLSLIGIKIEKTKVPQDKDDSKVIYQISVPILYGNKSDRDIALEGKSIIINALTKCDMLEEDIVVEYITREDEWSEEKGIRMKELIQNVNNWN